ncbi:MAG: hypothetical protein ACT4PX_00460 [Actinomycetota bacterium]
MSSRRLDVWLAVLAGPLPWADGRRLPAADRLLLVAQAVMAAGLGLLMVAVRSLDAEDALEVAAFAAAVMSALLALTLPALLATISADRRSPHPFALALARSAGAAGTMVLLVRELGSLNPVASTAFGLLAGTEVAVTLRVIGIELRVPNLVRRFLASTVHLGTVCGIALVAILSDGGTAVELVVTLYAVSFAAILTAAILGRALTTVDRAGAADAGRARAAAHREQAHWLHDDVCSHLGNLRLRLEASALGQAGVIALLNDLDHKMRMRQVEEILAGGPVRLAEVIQPYIRVAQNNGVRVAETPTAETASVLVDPETGRLLQRACAVLVTNAVQAGASQIGIRARLQGQRHLELEVEDDAGGIDMAAIIPGRGLDSLRRDVGEQGLELSRTAVGTRARVRVAVREAVEAG